VTYVRPSTARITTRGHSGCTVEGSCPEPRRRRARSRAPARRGQRAKGSARCSARRGRCSGDGSAGSSGAAGPRRGAGPAPDRLALRRRWPAAWTVVAARASMSCSIRRTAALATLSCSSVRSSWARPHRRTSRRHHRPSRHLELPLPLPHRPAHHRRCSRRAGRRFLERTHWSDCPGRGARPAGGPRPDRADRQAKGPA
jgi:hypothetical protein